MSQLQSQAAWEAFVFVHPHEAAEMDLERFRVTFHKLFLALAGIPWNGTDDEVRALLETTDHA